MPDPNEPDDVESSAEPAKPTQPDRVKPGGFGAFAEVYRARWAANHPHMRRTEVTDMPATPPPSSNGTADKRSVAKDGTRLIRPEDHK